MENHRDESWKPQTASDHDLVLRELEEILASHHFRNSRRYPALLRYVVTQTLNGNAAHLKERTLGVEVFHRKPDYDTNADPVVRLSAGEVRKRIAQYYQECGLTSFQIGIPLGGYAAEFRRHEGSLETTRNQELPAANAERAVRAPTKAERDSSTIWSYPVSSVAEVWHSRTRVALSLVLVISVTLAAAYALYGMTIRSASERMWSPILRPAGSVLVVVGNGPRQTSAPVEAAQADKYDHVHGPYDHVSVCEAIALSRVAQVMGQHAKSYEVKEADLTRLEDMRGHPTILVGAYDNLWSMRLVEPLRFHFVKANNIVQIVDKKDPKNNSWSVDYVNSYSAVPADYAVIARYHDPTTNGPVLIIAGIGAYGTEAATEFLATPRYLEQASDSGTQKSSERNIEMVIKTNVVNGSAGPPQLVSSTTW